MKKTLSILKNTAIMAAITLAVSWLNLHLRFTLGIRSMVPMLYVLGVFFVALCTDGYFYGISSAFISAFLVMHAFSLSDSDLSYKFNIITSIIIIFFVAMLTCTVTTMLKKARRIKEANIREHIRGNIMRAMSHDLRTPLTSIYASSSAILDNFEDLSDDQRLELVNKIRTESHGLIRMIENLLSVTKANDDSVKLAMTDTVLEELIDTVAVKFNRHFPETSLILDIPDEFVSIPMDAMMIEQVLFNLLENAVIHAIGMTKLVLKVYLEGNRVWFEVSDNGCGLHKDRPDKVFYEHHDSTLMTNETGTKRNMGIGLRACDAVVKAHNSRIYAENNAEGGASFRFSLKSSDNE